MKKEVVLLFIENGENKLYLNYKIKPFLKKKDVLNLVTFL